MPIANTSALFAEPFTIITPDGRRYGCFRCRGKTTDYVALVEWYAQKELLSGKVAGDDFVLASGERFNLGDCQLIEAYIVDNDTRQERRAEQFRAGFDEAARLLSVEFGAAAPGGTEAEESIPLSGVFVATFWEISGTRLFLAAAHEDREAPFLLMTGCL